MPNGNLPLTPLNEILNLFHWATKERRITAKATLGVLHMVNRELDTGCRQELLCEQSADGLRDDLVARIAVVQGIAGFETFVNDGARPHVEGRAKTLDLIRLQTQNTQTQIRWRRRQVEYEQLSHAAVRGMVTEGAVLYHIQRLQAVHHHFAVPIRAYASRGCGLLGAKYTEWNFDVFGIQSLAILLTIFEYQ